MLAGRMRFRLAAAARLAGAALAYTPVLSGMAAPAPGAAGVTPAPARASASTDYRLAVWPARAPSPDFQLTDCDGHPRTLRDYRGHDVIVFFGFVHCPDACPTELLKLAQSLKRLGPDRAKFQVLFITLDPERDTPAVLKDYVRAFDPGFVGLRGDSAQVDRAAANFNVEYARVPLGADYTIDHSTALYVFDARGNLRLVGSVKTSNADLNHDLAVLASQ